MSTTLNAYKASDFVHVVDGITGEVMKAPVPKSWIGTDLLPPGSKKATSKQLEGVEDLEQAKDPASPYGAAAAASSNGDDEVDPNAEPAGNASRDAWVAYAKTKGAGDADLVDAEGNDLSRDELRTKYAAPAS